MKHVILTPFFPGLKATGDLHVASTSKINYSCKYNLPSFFELFELIHTPPTPQNKIESLLWVFTMC